MTLSSQTFRTLLVAASLVASAVTFAQSGTSREREAPTATTSTRGILHGLDLARFRNLQLVEEDVPADAPTVVLLNDAAKARGRASSHMAEAFVYKNFSAGRNNQTAFFFNWASTSGGSGDPDCPGGLADGCFTPAVTVPGIFEADGAVFGNGFKAGETAVSSYEIFAFRSSSDPDTQDLAFVEMELWDGDPLNALDSTGIGFSAAPIPGTKVTFTGVPFNTKIVFRGELDPPVVTPHDRVWVVVTSDACRFGWLLSLNAPEVGADDHERLAALTGSGTGIFEIQLDIDGKSNGLGVCCGDDCDGSPCDVSIGMQCCADPAGNRGQCADGDAEDMSLANFGGSTCSFDPQSSTDACSNFWLNIYAEAEVTMSIQPTGNGPLGALAPGARIEGNEIIMVAGGENVFFDIQLSNFDTTPLTELRCVGGNNPGAPCTLDTEITDCGFVDSQADPPSYGCGLKLRAYQAELDSTGFTSGLAGELTAASVPCANDSECVATFGGACATFGFFCTSNSECEVITCGFADCRCVGPSCVDGECEFAFINSSRFDYIFRGRAQLAAVDISTPDFRWRSALLDTAIRPWDPFPAGGANLGELVLTTSPDATGTFTLNLKPVPASLLLDAQNGFIGLLRFVPAKITVTTGQCCNIDLDALQCLTDQITAGGCAEIGANNGFAVSFDPTKTCADVCSPCPNGLDSECDDGDSCTTDTCIDALTCESVLAASDGTECLSGFGPACIRTTIDDGDKCTDDACSGGGGRGVAINTPSASGTTCDDGTPCTIDDVCDGINSDENGGCGGSLVNDIQCITDADCPLDPAGVPFRCITGFCFCLVPVAGFEVTGGTPSVNPITGDAIVCAEVGEKLNVNIELGPSANTINGGQFIITWDPTCLDFQGITTAAPYTTVLSNILDEASGTLFWAVGIDPFNPPETRGSNFGNLSFVKLPGCDGCEVCFDSSNPQNLVLVDDAGDPVNVQPSCSDLILGNPNLTISVPGSQKVNADCDSNTALVTWAAPSSADSCAGTSISCTGVHNESGTDLSGMAMTGGNLPIGTSSFSCKASNNSGCAGSAGGSWTIEVNDQTTLDVVVQLSPTIANSNLLRAIEFELFSDCVQAPQTFTRNLHFGGLFDLTAHFTDTVKTSAAGQFVCITARDRLHTLRSVDFLTCADGVYSATFKGDPFFGGKWLVGGNLDAWKPGAGIPGGNPDVIDILDFGQFVAGFGTCPGADTPDGTEGPHADINGDGCVDSLDFSYIDRNFLAVSKNSCCPDGNAAGMIAITEVSVRDLRAQGLGDLTVADLNGDGMVNADDMAAFSAGAVPKAKSSRQQTNTLRDRR